MQEIMSVNPKEILFDKYADGSYINPRGPVRDTTDLEVSISQTDGQFIDMPLCYIHEGRIYCLDGHRRITLARNAGWEKIQVRIKPDFDPSKARRYMLATATRKDYPDIVLDQSGVVIGGICRAVMEELQDSEERGQPITYYELAKLIGDKTPDVISAYVSLYHAPLEVKRKVAEGKLSITAFSLIKHAKPETQVAIVTAVEPDQRVTAEKIRNDLRANRGESGREGAGEGEGASPVAMLNQAKSLILKALKHPDFDPRCDYLLEELVNLIEREAV